MHARNVSTLRRPRACMRNAIVAACAIASMSCAAASNNALDQSSMRDTPRTSTHDDWRLIGSYADVRAVAVARSYVFAATPNGVSVYDRVFNSWLAPLTLTSGLADGPITVMAGDPVEDAVWIGVTGGVLLYRPRTEQAVHTIITGIPDVILFDRSLIGDAFVRAGGQWTRVSRAGIATPVTGPPPAAQRVAAQTLSDVYARYPGLRNGSPLLFREQRSDRPLRNYQVTSGGLSLDTPSDVWLGTSGDGLYRVDGVLQHAAALRYGTMERGVAVVGLAADGVWTVGLGLTSFRGGLTFASNDLQRWRWIDGTIAVPMINMRPGSMSIRGSRAWIGTDRGLVRAQLDASEQLASWTSLNGLPDDRVLAVSATSAGVWVGTARGLVFVSDSGALTTPAAALRGATPRDLRLQSVSAPILNIPVLALQQVGDTLWIGTVSGLYALPAGGALSAPVGQDPSLRRRISALAYSDTALFVATDNGVMQLKPTGGVEPQRLTAINVATVGQVTRLAADDRIIVLTGTDGVVVTQRHGGTRVLRIPADVPGPVLDVVLSREFIWFATVEGLLRVRRDSDGGIR